MKALSMVLLVLGICTANLGPAILLIGAAALLAYRSGLMDPL